MTELVYITRQNQATFICPECRRTVTADVSRYVNLPKKVTVKCTCTCGHRFAATLDKRRQYRKNVNLPGIYTVLQQGPSTDRGKMTVIDLSTAGLKFQLNVPPSFAVGELLEVEFRLNDAHRTLVRKKVEVRFVSGKTAGAAYATAGPLEPALGFYLLGG